MYTLITLYTKGFVVETGSRISLYKEYEKRKVTTDVVAVYYYDSDGDLVDSHHI